MKIRIKIYYYITFTSVYPAMNLKMYNSENQYFGFEKLLMHNKSGSKII